MKPSFYPLARPPAAAMIAAVLLATFAAMRGSASTVAVEARRTAVTVDPQDDMAALLSSSPRLSDGSEAPGLFFGRGLQANQAEVVECTPSPLWTKVVHPSKYEIGCEEIEEMLRGRKTLIAHGHMRDAFLLDYKNRKLVVKTLREEWKYSHQRQRLDAVHQWEASALDAVRGHPQIVEILGVCNTTSSVTEYFGDNLGALLSRSRHEPLHISDVLPLALDAARGLQALHEAPGGPIVHFNLKPQQLLLDHEGGLKINDLNMCRFVATDGRGHTCPFSTAHAATRKRWRSPENMAGEAMTEKVDIYSMGMIFYVMLSGRLPFESESQLMAPEGETRFIDPTWHRGFVEIIEDMWRREPGERPSAGAVVARLEAIEKDL